MSKKLEKLAEIVLDTVHKYDKELKVELTKSKVMLMDEPSRKGIRYIISITKI